MSHPDTSKKAIEHCTAPLDEEAQIHGHGTHIAANMIRALAAERDQIQEQLAAANAVIAKEQGEVLQLRKTVEGLRAQTTRLMCDDEPRAAQLDRARNDALAEMSRMIKTAILGGKVGAGDGNTHYLRTISTGEVDNIEVALRAQAAPTSVQKVHESQEATSMQNLHESPLPQAYEARGREVWRLGAWHDEDDTCGPVDFCLCTVSEAAYDPKDDAQKIAYLLNAHASQNSLRKVQTIREERAMSDAPERYGRVRVSKVRAAYIDLRSAVRAGDIEAAQETLDRYEQWADFVFHERHKGREQLAGKFWEDEECQ